MKGAHEPRWGRRGLAMLPPARVPSWLYIFSNSLKPHYTFSFGRKLIWEEMYRTFWITGGRGKGKCFRGNRFWERKTFFKLSKKNMRGIFSCFIYFRRKDILVGGRGVLIILYAIVIYMTLQRRGGARRIFIGLIFWWGKGVRTILLSEIIIDTTTNSDPIVFQRQFHQLVMFLRMIQGGWRQLDESGGKQLLPKLLLCSWQFPIIIVLLVLLPIECSLTPRVVLMLTGVFTMKNGCIGPATVLRA